MEKSSNLNDVDPPLPEYEKDDSKRTEGTG